MSKEALIQVLTRTAQDPGFNQRVRDDPTVLDQFELTAEEKEALRTADTSALEAMDVDRRQTKWFLAKDV